MGLIAGIKHNSGERIHFRYPVPKLIHNHRLAKYVTQVVVSSYLVRYNYLQPASGLSVGKNKANVPVTLEAVNRRSSVPHLSCSLASEIDILKQRFCEHEVISSQLPPLTEPFLGITDFVQGEGYCHVF